MSNRVDFFQSEQSRLALPAASVLVSLDGMLCPFLEVKQIARCGNPEFSWAKLCYNPAGYADGGVVDSEDIESIVAMGRAVRIEQVANIGSPGVLLETITLFSGYIEEIQTGIGSDGERIEIIARDISCRLRRVTVYGQRALGSDNSSLFMAGLETVFNPNSKPNASSESAEANGSSYTVFSANSLQCKMWSYAEVIIYLLSEHLPAGQLGLMSLEFLEGLTNGQTVRDLDVTGLDLIEALQRCCKRIGLRFRFDARLVPSGPPEQIVFYRPDQGRTVELNCQKLGEQLSISKTNVAGLHSKKKIWPITHRFIGQGDFKVYEATFDLVEAWDPALGDTDYDKFSPAANENFYQVRDVYRKWCLNEAGDYTDSPYNCGDAFDFSRIFEGDDYLCHRRRFWPSLTVDKKGTSLGYYLEASYDSGNHWWLYLYAFNNLLDECGIWLSSEQLDFDTWYAALKGYLKFRITASVISDQRISHTVAGGPINSVIEVVDHVVTLPRQFKYRQVDSSSIFKNSTDDNIGLPDVADDSSELVGFVRGLADEYSGTIEDIEVETPMLAFDYQPGDKVAMGTAGRDLLGCRNDKRSICRIERVCMDFDRQCTKLEITRKRK